MADINTLLKRILSAVYGKDVRQSIHDAIRQCYNDGRAGAIDLTARERVNDLFPTVKPTAYSWEHLDQIVTARVSSMVGAVANITVACDFDDIVGDIFVTVHKGNNPETGLFVSAVHPTGCRLHRRGQLVGDPGVLQWDDWEWENPPMEEGVEYRTTERHLGDPVYTKCIGVTVPDVNGTASVAIFSDNVDGQYNCGAIVAIDGVVFVEDQGLASCYSLPSSDVSVSAAHAIVQDEPATYKLFVRNHSGNYVAQGIAWITVKYTK